MLCAVWAGSPLAYGRVPYPPYARCGMGRLCGERKRRKRCERLKGARNAARGRRRVPLGHTFYAARQRSRGGWPRPPLAPWGAGRARHVARERFECPKDARNAAWGGRWRFMPMGCAIYPRIYVACCDAVWRGVSRLGRYILGYTRHAHAPAPLPAACERFECPKDARNAAWGRRRRISPGHACCPSRQGSRRVRPLPPRQARPRAYRSRHGGGAGPACCAQAFRAPLRRKKRASPHRPARYAGPPARTSRQRFGGPQPSK